MKALHISLRLILYMDYFTLFLQQPLLLLFPFTDEENEPQKGEETYTRSKN